jgi:predicted aspartyl protease
MGMIKKKVKITNYADIVRSKDGAIPAGKIRSVQVEAIIDSGARMLCLPADLVETLGLEKIDKKTVRYANGEKDIKEIGSTVTLELMDRKTSCHVLIEKTGAPILVGQIPLEDLDLLIDMAKEDLVVNPESPYMPLAYMY